MASSGGEAAPAAAGDEAVLGGGTAAPEDRPSGSDLAGSSKVEPQEDSVVDQGRLGNAPLPELLGLFKEMQDKHGGPMQYLLQAYPDETSKDKFAEELLSKVPPQAQHHYYVGPACPNDDTVIVCHPADLDFSFKATTRTAPYKVTCLALAEEFLVNGFLTQGVGCKSRNRIAALPRFPPE